MHKLEKLILESYNEIEEGYGTGIYFKPSADDLKPVLGDDGKPLEEESNTLGLEELPKSFRDTLEKRYGISKWPEKDFVSSDLTTYFKTTSVEKETGNVGHDVIQLPSFEGLYTNFSDIINDIKKLMRSDEVRKDKAARELFEIIKTNFRKLQRYLRTERPDQYELMKMRRNMEEAVAKLNEYSLTIGKKKVAKLHKNGNDASNWEVEFEDGTKEPYLNHLRSDYKQNENNSISELKYKKANEEAGPETVLEDATDQMLEKFPTLKAALIKLQTEDFKEFVDTIDWISPRPTAFRINLTNGQEYILKWTGTGFEAQIMGKRYYIDKVNDYQQALDKLSILYKEGPMGNSTEEPAEPADNDTGSTSGGGGDFPGTDTAGGGGEEGGDIEDLGGEEGGEEGGADLTAEPVDFEEPAEEPEA